MKTHIIFYSIICILFDIVAWFAIDDEKLEGDKSKFNLSDMKTVFKMPAVWMAGIAAFSIWSIYMGFGMVTLYITDIFLKAESQTAFASILRAYVFLLLLN